MKEYIERAAVKNLLERYGATNDAMALIDIIPADDVVEVRHGRWTGAESDDEYLLWHCSECSYPVKTIAGHPVAKYCPRCGARMDKEDEHETG